MNLNMIGTGYVGLVTGACFAENADNHVICTDVDEKKIERLKNGEIPIFEKGLEDLVIAGLERGNLEFTTNIDYAVNNSLINFICVGTPSKDDGSADLQYIEAAARDIGRFMKTFEYKIIVDKSTVPVRTFRLVEKWMREELKKRTEMYRAFDVVSCPEFLKEGTAVEDFSKPDRVVIGTNSERAGKIMTELFTPLSMNRKPIIMRTQEAELVKYGANSFLAKRIAFVQELARMADTITNQSGDYIDILRVLEGICSDSRIGNIFMKPGPGYGGSCFPKDTRELAELADRMNMNLPIIEGTNRSNDIHKEYLLEKVLNRYDHNLSGKTIGVWGLAFKAKTDDIRESAAITFIDGLLDRGAEIKCYDPEAMEQAELHFGADIFYAQDKYDAAKGADGLIIATEWNEFKTPDFNRLKKEMRAPVIFDFRNLYGQQRLDDKLNKLGFEWYGVGR